MLDKSKDDRVQIKEKQKPFVVPEEQHTPPTSDTTTTKGDRKDSDNVTAPSTGRKEKMVVAYWTDWTSGTMPPEAIPFDKVTHVNYAFSIVTPEFKPVFETDPLLKRLVKSAHANNVKVLMSIGGWTGSQYFSPLAATWGGRKTFIDGAIDIIRLNGIDGIDIDWYVLIFKPSLQREHRHNPPNNSHSFLGVYA